MNIIDTHVRVCQIQITQRGGSVPNTILLNSPNPNWFPHPHPQLPKVTIHLKETRFQNVKAIQRHVIAELHVITQDAFDTSSVQLIVSKNVLQSEGITPKKMLFHVYLFLQH